jgi:N-acetylglucosamine malate deacetylase 1
MFMEDLKGKRVLVVTAHPDDETLGCGGTIRLMARRDAEVSIISCFTGFERLGRNGQDFSALARAAKHLGVPSSRVRSLEYRCYDYGFPQFEFNRSLGMAVRDFAPHMVLTHYCDDLNTDHQLVARAVTVECRPTTGVRRLLMFETISSTEYNFGIFGKKFSPDTYVSLSRSDLDAKKRALAEYGEEVRKFPHPRSPEGMENQARYHGKLCNVELAEAFMTVYSVEGFL